MLSLEPESSDDLLLMDAVLRHSHHYDTTMRIPRLTSRGEFPGTLRHMLSNVGAVVTNSSSSSDGEEHRRRHWATLWYRDRALEEAFLSHCYGDWSTRMVFSLAIAAMGVGTIVAETTHPMRIQLCFAACCVLWASTAIVCAVCKLRVRQEQQLRDQQQEVEQARESAAMMPRSSSSPKAISEVLGLAQPVWHRKKRNNRAEHLAFYTELVSIWWLYGGLILYMVAAILANSDCSAQPTEAERYDACYRVYDLDANIMMLVVAATTFAPIRFVFFLLFVLAVVGAFVLANLMGPSESYVEARFVSSLVVLVTQQLVCAVWLFRREREARDTFVAQSNLAQQTREWHEVRNLAEAAATRAVSQEAVKQLLLRGERSVECPAALVCCFSIGNFARWSRSRSPSDVVHLLNEVSRVFESALHPLSTYEPTKHVEGRVPTFAKVHTFGEEAMFVFEHVLEDGMSRSRNSTKRGGAAKRRTLRSDAAAVYQSVVRAITKAERIVSDNNNNNSAAVAKGVPVEGHDSSLVVGQHQQLQEDVPSAPLFDVLTTRSALGSWLQPVASIAVGPVTLAFLPTVCTTVASGAVVQECYAGLRLAIARVVDGCLPSSQVSTDPSDDSHPSVTVSQSAKIVLGQHSNNNPASATTRSSSGTLEQRSSVVLSVDSGSTGKMGESALLIPLTTTTTTMTTTAQQLLEDDVLPSMVATTIASQQRDTGDPHANHPAVAAAPLASSDRRSLASYHETRCLLSNQFTDPKVERTFREYAHENFEHRVVVLNAVCMVGLALAMVFVCGVYDQWSWSVRSPLPYVVCSGLVGPLMLLTLWCQPPCMVGCLEALNWVFLYACIAASALSPQRASIFGGSLLPWLYVGATVALQRPLWYPPVAMWALDASFSLVMILSAILPLRAVSAQRAMVGVVLGVGTLIASFLLRSFLDVMERRRYATRCELQDTRRKLEGESDHLLQALQEIAPNRVAERMLKRCRTKRRSCRPNNGRSALLTTACEDQVFAVVHVYALQPTTTASSARSSVCGNRHGVPLPSPQGVQETPAEAQSLPSSLMQARQQLSIDDLSTVNGRIQACVSECHGVVVKSCGDVLLLGLDEDTSIGSRCRSEVVHHMVHMVLHLKQAVSAMLVRNRQEGSPSDAGSPYELPAAAQRRGVECRAWVGMSLMMGAMIGAQAPSFEWYGVDVSTALHVVRRAPLAADSPVPPNAVVLSERAAYYFDQLAASPMISNPRSTSQSLEGDDAMQSDLEHKHRLGCRGVWSIAGVGQCATYRLLSR